MLTKTKKELRSLPPAAPALTDTGVWGASALSRAPPANPPITLRRMFERFPDKINQISHQQPATSCLDSTFQETSKSTAAPTRLANEPPPAPFNGCGAAHVLDVVLKMGLDLDMALKMDLDMDMDLKMDLDIDLVLVSHRMWICSRLKCYQCTVC